MQHSLSTLRSEARSACALGATIEQLNASVRELRAQIEDLMRANEMLVISNDKLKSDAESRGAQFEDTRKTLEHSVSILTSQLKERRATDDIKQRSLRADISAMQDRIVESEADAGRRIESLTNEATRQSHLAVTRHDEIVRLNEVIDEDRAGSLRTTQLLQSNIRHLESQLDVANRELCRCTSTLHRMECDNTALQAKMTDCDKMADAMQSVTAKLESVTNDNERLRSLNSTLLQRQLDYFNALYQQFSRALTYPFILVEWYQRERLAGPRPLAQLRALRTRRFPL